MSNSNRGKLYVVATPIGNLEDLAPRARRVLGEAALIAAEDTRHSGRLLAALGIRTPMRSLHEHNEAQMVADLIARLEAGQDVALISDAGTPLISDPGFLLVRACQDAGITVVPIPGPSALIAALSVSGLPPDRFRFEGFLPRNAGRRREALLALRDESATLIFYESPHRLLQALEDLVTVFGPDRPAVLARELTKLHETLIRAPLGELHRRVMEDPDQRLGEVVLLVNGLAPSLKPDSDRDVDEMLRVLLGFLPVRQAAAAAAQLTGEKKNALYERALAIREKD